MGDTRAPPSKSEGIQPIWPEDSERGKMTLERSYSSGQNLTLTLLVPCTILVGLHLPAQFCPLLGGLGQLAPNQ